MSIRSLPKRARRGRDASRLRECALRQWFARATAFKNDQGGIAVVEFALVLPVMVTLCFTLAEVCNAVQHQRKVALFARALADLSGRNRVSTMTPIFDAAGAILAPYDASTAKIRVSAIGVTQKGLTFTGSVCSSAASANTTARPVKQKAGTNGIPNVPGAFQYDKAHYVLAEVTMPYKPIVGGEIVKELFGAGGLTFSKQIPWADRSGGEIVLPGGSVCS